MNRPMLSILALLALIVAVGALFLLMEPGTPPPAPANAPEPEAVDPLKAEMACVDRVIQNRNMAPEDVQPAIARCRAGGSAAETNVLQ